MLGGNRRRFSKTQSLVRNMTMTYRAYAILTLLALAQSVKAQRQETIRGPMDSLAPGTFYARCLDAQRGLGTCPDGKLATLSSKICYINISWCFGCGRGVLPVPTIPGDTAIPSIYDLSPNVFTVPAGATTQCGYFLDLCRKACANLAILRGEYAILTCWSVYASAIRQALHRIFLVFGLFLFGSLSTSTSNSSQFGPGTPAAGKPASASPTGKSRDASSSQ